MRIDDLDTARAEPRFEALILADLAWLIAYWGPTGETIEQMLPEIGRAHV